MQQVDIQSIDWQKVRDLVPAIVQDAASGKVLMLGYMNQAALEQTLQTKRVTFYSRTRQALWTKGETSGHYLDFVELYIDCDHDSLLVLAKPHGPTCHQGTSSCFAKVKSTWQPMRNLEKIIQKRATNPSAKSYTCSLLAAGRNKIAQKVGEEATETIIAALAETDERLVSEMADLYYHSLVLLCSRGLSIQDVFTVLQERMQN